MSTSGLVVITYSDGIIAKVIAGCNGQQAATLAQMLTDLAPTLSALTPLEDLYRLAADCKFGCEACLVVMNSARAIHTFGDDLPQRYWDTFWQMDGNPRLPADRDRGFEFKYIVNLRQLSEVEQNG
jgi:hypothetical protein